MTFPNRDLTCDLWEKLLINQNLTFPREVELKQVGEQTSRSVKTEFSHCNLRRIKGTNVCLKFKHHKKKTKNNLLTVSNMADQVKDKKMDFTDDSVVFHLFSGGVVDH